MVFYYPIPILGGYSSPCFEGKEVTVFLKILNRYFKDYGINDDEEKKERTAEYAILRLRRDIERLLEFKDSTVSWEEFQVVLLQEYRRDDSD